jgi:peptide/nickel transport system substrate-binding protein
MKGKKLSSIACIFSVVFIVVTLFPLWGAMGAQKNYVRIATHLTPGDLNPFNATGQAEEPYAGYVYEPLCLQTMDGKFEPLLAKSWEYNKNDVSWIFHLDERAKWQDGKPVTAEDVKYSFDTHYKFNFAGGARTKKFVKSVDVIDDHTVAFRLNEPIGAFLSGAGAVFIMPKHVWSKIDDPAAVKEPNYLGSGPFMLKEYKPNRYIHYEANKNYWRFPVAIDGVIVKFYGTVEAGLLALQKGNIDIVSDLEGLETLIPRLKKDKNITVFMEKYSNQRMLMLVNHRKYPNNLREFRQAISMAVDRKAILDHAYHGYGTMPRMGSIAPGVTEWVNPKVKWPGEGMSEEARIGEANAMLDKLGFKRGDDGIRVTPNGRRLDLEMFILGTPSYTRQAEIIVANVKKIGIKATARSMDAPSLVGGYIYSGKKSDGWEWSFINYPKPADPDWYTTEYGADPPNAWFDSSAVGWNDNPDSKEMQELLRKARRATDKQQRWEMIQKAQELFARDLPVIVLGHQVVVGVYRTDRFEGWSPMGVTYLEASPTLLTVKTITSLRPTK